MNRKDIYLCTKNYVEGLSEQRELYINTHTALTDLFHENIFFPIHIYVCIIGCNKHAVVNGQCLFFIILLHSS